MTRAKRTFAVAILALGAGLYLGAPYLEVGRLWLGIVGVDVSHHQGPIDWQKLSKTDVRFAYLKATEGGDYVDPLFKQNWDGARKAGLIVGAYHFFSRCKTGAEQAKNFLAAVSYDAEALPPVLDAETMEACDGKAADLDPLEEVQAFMDVVKDQLGCKPVLYVTAEFDLNYLSGHLKAESFWVRSIFFPPPFRRDSWKFWQYHDAGHRSGINGPVDLNVFRGTRQQLDDFRKASNCARKGTT